MKLRIICEKDEHSTRDVAIEFAKGLEDILMKSFLVKIEESRDWQEGCDTLYTIIRKEKTK